MFCNDPDPQRAVLVDLNSANEDITWQQPNGDQLLDCILETKPFAVKELTVTTQDHRPRFFDSALKILA